MFFLYNITSHKLITEEEKLFVDTQKKIVLMIKLTLTQGPCQMSEYIATLVSCPKVSPSLCGQPVLLNRQTLSHIGM